MKQVGALIERLKQGENTLNKHHNPYVYEALEYQNLLYIESEIPRLLTNYFHDKSAPVIIEIGCYLGKNLLEFATHLPTHQIIGLDITYKRAVTTARRITKNNLQNASVALLDGLSFLRAIPNYSLAGACVFFPDPWPKKKHVSNRLVREDFFNLLHSKLAAQGFFWFKTDSESYYTETLDAANSVNGFKFIQGVQPEVFANIESVTTFEKLFIQQKKPIYSGVFYKLS